MFQNIAEEIRREICLGGAGKSGWSVSFSVCLDRHCCPHCSVPNAGSCIRLTAKRRERASICVIKQEVSDASGTVTLSCLKTVDHIGVCTQRCCFVTKACPTLHEPRGLELARARSLTISRSLPLFGDMLKYSVPFSASQISASFNMGI